MANYLTLVNNVLNELNEVELTSTTFSSSRGVQTMVKNVITHQEVLLMYVYLLQPNEQNISR